MLLADLIGRLKVEKANIAAALAEGHASTWESYHRLVGRHQGLDEALSIINQLLEEEKNVE